MHPGSLEIPPPIHNIQSIEDLLNRVSEETQQLELPTKKLFQKARNSLRSIQNMFQIKHNGIFRTISQTSHTVPPNLMIFLKPKENCDRCNEVYIICLIIFAIRISYSLPLYRTSCAIAAMNLPMTWWFTRSWSLPSSEKSCPPTMNGTLCMLSIIII